VAALFATSGSQREREKELEILRQRCHTPHLMKKKTATEDTLTMYREIWKRAMSQVGAGESAKDAIGELANELGRLQQQISEAENLFRIAQSAEEAAGPKHGSAKAAQAPLIPPRRGRRLSQAERSSTIKKVAAEVAAAAGGEVNVKAVADAVKAQGVDLNTSVPGTMIGNVLNKSTDWHRVDRGVYQYVAAKA
jgi:hypothetical protein